MVHVGTFRGIPLYLHWSWLLFIGFMVLLKGPLFLIFLLPIFGLVVLHEYGHCAAAQYYDIHVEDVVLYPIGGIARMHFNPGDAKQEIVIALAGPAVNVVLGILSLIVAYVAYLIQEPYTLLVSVILLYMNAVIAGFNLLPIFPMDGGRVLRGVLASLMDFERATWWAVRVGQTLCVAGIGVAVALANPILVVIFLMMILGGQQELVAASQYACFQRIKDKLAEGLNRPDLKTASLPEVIDVLEDVRDDELRQRFYYDELVPLLKDWEEMTTPDR